MPPRINKQKHLHSSPTVDGQTLHNQYAELEEEDEEKQEKIERTVPPATQSQCAIHQTFHYSTTEKCCLVSISKENFLNQGPSANC